MSASSWAAKKEQLLDLLGSLYEALSRELGVSQSSPNVCGRCRECCTDKGLTFQNVTPLEFEFIESREGSAKIADFERFVKRDGAFEVCPYFDESTWGCGIYTSRPFSCRIFGHYRSEDTVLPEVCVFRGQEAIFASGDYYKAVPQAAELRTLVRRFWPFGVSAQGAPSPVDVLAGGGASAGVQLGHGDALDRALLLQSQNRLQEALSILAGGEVEQTVYSLYCLSLILEGLGLHGDACRALQVALREAPELGILHFRLACNAFQNGDPVLAERHFLATLKYDTDNLEAGGLLGALLLQQKRYREARPYLFEASKRAPANETWTSLLEQLDRSGEGTGTAFQKPH